MSMLKSEQTDYHNHQAKTMEQVAVYNAPCWLEVMQKMALSFLVVLCDPFPHQVFRFGNLGGGHKRD